MKKSRTKKDHYQDVTNRILAMLEAGTKPWECPWVREKGGGIMPRNLTTGNQYRGINIPLLWYEMNKHEYESAYFLTYKQAQAKGGQVRKGEHGAQCFFYKKISITEEKDGQKEEKLVPMLRTFTVFNVEQCDGVEAPTDGVEALPGGFDPIPFGERVIASSGVTTREKGQRACYIPSIDEVHMPNRERFDSAENFYATMLHELTHATGHSSRLDRKKGNAFGSAEYAYEELIAEMGSAFLTATLGIQGDIENHASYIDSWISVLKHNKKAFFRACTEAQKAADWLLDRYETHTATVDEAA